ncbi:MAG TPA: sugar phosphate isomerase/epimerase [Dehalococcoidia bacterium]|jgi:inosose dehydratase|nr:hypothetical protein [Chloroflexota bacterium]MDP5877648.1 sugar phosphate isomerase/epimerase [Dehalococcoidia bacterium]MDP6272547.1 sugar phosphate isomerase/epimerase [Dehalococcoidia bacterium]MDP7212869.1 sugar phosphate isomerase/epimerase [Dehalococcoidia bacterium]MDP7514682.1 sugar phosphate isomerase/epimerase [Dehalococcoidia bacterium]|tara:strand:- start:15 stop:902 length:888 start_codon:yes stop_codon:yes gene_type:complete
MSIKVGSAPDSWGVWFADDPRQTPWRRFLDELAEAGYQRLEIGPYGYLPTDPATLTMELEARGLKAAAGMVMSTLEDQDGWPGLERQLLDVGELVCALGAGHLVLIDGPYSDLITGDPMAPNRLDDDAWRRLIDTTEKLAEMARSKFGLKAVFHPHADTHIEYEDQIERFLDDTDPDNIALCLDLGHHAYRGGDPVEFMRKHHERIPYLHLKSVDASLRDRVNDEGLPFAEAMEIGVFCEPEGGAIDFKELAALLNEIEFDGYAIVEQDMPPQPLDRPLPVARRTLKYLREIGIA